MNPEIAARLREPFDAKLVGKLPRLTCKVCRENKGVGACSDHRKARCPTCGNYISTAHIHLDYVGHAEVTDRLLQVDSEWSWEPVGLSDGLPALDRDGGLWIRLTVAGVTRLGYGSADGKSGPDAVKECIGDAIRNAAMRFGVGLDLWGAKFKGEDSDHDEVESSSAQWDGARPTGATAEQVARFDELAKQIATAESAAGLKVGWDMLVGAYKADEITTRQANELKAEITRRKDELSQSEVPSGEF